MPLTGTTSGLLSKPSTVPITIGLCPDTFQTAGGEWAGPRPSSGLLEDVSREELEKRFQKSLQDLSGKYPNRESASCKLASYAYKVSQPLAYKRDKAGLLPHSRRSHNLRPLLYNGGYLPFANVAHVVGFRGWLSYEVFDEGKDGKKINEEIVAYAYAARNLHTRLLEECI